MRPYFLILLIVSLSVPAALLLPRIAVAEQDESADTDVWNTPANEDEMYVSEVVGYRIRPTDEGTGFAETLEVSEARKTVSDLSDVLSQAAGLQVRSMGGLGAYCTAAARGATPGQMPVFLDGVPLNVGGFSVVNLGDFSLDIIERVEVYRGTAPLRLGTPGIGGAVALITKDFSSDILEFATSLGSFNSWRLLTLYGAHRGKTDVLAVVSGGHSDGDFLYYNRNGTFNNTADDAFVRRQNNDYTALSAMIKLRRDAGPWNVQLVDELFEKNQGLAGIDSMIDESAAGLDTLRNSLRLRFERPLDENVAFSLDAGYVFMSEHFDDTKGSIGTGRQDKTYRTHEVSAAALLTATLSPKHKTTVRLSERFAHYSEQDGYDSQSDRQAPSQRLHTELGVEHDFSPISQLHLTSGLRGAFYFSHFGGGATPALLTDFEEVSKIDFFFSPGLGIRFEPLDGLIFRVNGGRYNRTPDLSELFGDRGAVIGNPDLRSEVGYNLDAGITYILTGKSFLDLLRVDGAWFASRVQDLISLEQNSQSTSRPVNIDAATMEGVECSLRLDLLNTVGFSGNYTFFRGVNRSDMPQYRGKQLPGRPVHEAYGRIDLHKDLSGMEIGGWFDADYAGKAYAGQYNNEDFVTLHFFLGAGVRTTLLDSGLTVTLEVKNLADALIFKNDNGAWLPMSDYNRYPLPGRTFFLTLHYKLP